MSALDTYRKHVLRPAFFIGTWLVGVMLHAQATLNVEVILNKPEAGGILRIALCPDKASYDSEQGCRLQSVEAVGRTARSTFSNVAPGTYAIKVFHDINADNKLNTSWIGWPQEPYGFSNDAPVNMGPPPFRLAAFEVGTKETTHRIALR